MKKYYLAFALFFFCLRILVSQQDFKVVGYLSSQYFDLSDQIDYSKLTHLNIGFFNPNFTGYLLENGYDIDPIVQAAKQEGVTVLITLGERFMASNTLVAWEYLQLPANRTGFIRKIIDFIQDHELDGVDMNLQWFDIGNHYSPFVLQLRDSLTAHGLLLSVALPGDYRYPNLTDEALQAFDYINVMAFDLTGPWESNSPGQHSPYILAVQSINFWQAHDVTADRLNLGVPFYGWDFGNSGIPAVAYRDIVALNPANAQLDKVGELYYNGIPTIRAKTNLALANVGGIMMWQIGHDTFDENALLTTVYNTVAEATDIEDPLMAATIRAYPSPFTQNLYIDNESSEACTIRLTDVNGRMVQQHLLNGLSSLTMAVQDLTPGFYFLQQQSGTAVRTVKLVKG